MWCLMEYFRTYHIVLCVGLIFTVKGDLEIYAVPDRISEGGSLEITCRPSATQPGFDNQLLPESGDVTDDVVESALSATAHAQDAMKKCNFRWTRTHMNARQVAETESPAGGSAAAALFYYTSRGENAAPVQSTVAVSKMSAEYEGVYTCFLECPGRLESASIRLRLGQNDGFLADRGAVVASIVAFVLIGIGLVAVGFTLFRDRCRRSRTSGSTQSLMTSEQSSDESSARRQFSDPPPRYSVVVVATTAESTSGYGSGAGNKSGSEIAKGVGDQSQRRASLQRVFVLPPDYEQALKDLEQKGVPFDSSVLRPMPPAYSETFRDLAENEIPFGNDTPAVLRLSSVESV